MQIAFLIYEGLTALDIIGPYEVFNQIPDADVRFVAKRSGSIRVDSGAFSIGVDHELADVQRPDVFVVPGGIAGTFAAAKDPEIWAAKSLLEQTGATYIDKRIVVADKIITAAGVSAGIDMALYVMAELVGAELAKLAQLNIEYDPEPPFDAGSPAKAGEALVQRALEEFAEELS